ncbi:ROK family protein [Anoxynatronum buryatiense]|uniref:fructokinase n=1 Tax=Anoxynatronum buryatiense TaxID=489973 RepID=A0AA46AJQ6_9CLOT|nr:ROK family protein [Anoxynatronum buryatiense]SMP63419.1 fructokinase [Anoxynatronum buryatiense]
MLAAIEAGGTKFVCAVGDHQFNIIDRTSFPTTYPEETMAKIIGFFDAYDEIEAMGIGSFGPIGINQHASNYGYITSTPKVKWRNYNFLGEMKKHYQFPIGWTTDVNAACLGEYHLGSGKDKHSCIYLTVGTGVGGGAIFNGRFIEGFGHAEMGHIILRNHSADPFQGVCPYHGNCLEGLASGPAIEKRVGVKAEELDKNHQVWEMIGHYLAQALLNYTLILRPERIILGGGVMNQSKVLTCVKKEFALMLAGYVDTPEVDEYIVLPSLGNNAGITGGLILAHQLL